MKPGFDVKTILRAFAISAALAIAPSAQAAHYHIMVSGVCSTASQVWDAGWGWREWWTLRQTHNMNTARDDLYWILEARCRNGHTCTLYGYSNGAAVISYLLSSYSDRWAILEIKNVNGNEGGTFVSSSLWGQIAQLFGSCPLITNVHPDAHRWWNHDDTNNRNITQKGSCMSPFWFLVNPVIGWEGCNDSILTLNSAAGYRELGWRTWLCDGAAGGARWSRHYSHCHARWDLWHVHGNQWLPSHVSY